MVAAGVGAKVGIVLFVLSEGRYHPQNFPDVAIDFSQLAWDPARDESNYSTLAQAALASGDGTGWLTESAQPANVSTLGYGASPSLAAAYRSSCSPPPLMTNTCGSEAGASGSAVAEAQSSVDAAESGYDPTDAEGGSLPEGGDDVDASDAAISEAGPCTPPPPACDDLDLAMTGIQSQLWVTRLRADLPASALANDLVIEATQSQAAVSNTHATSKYTDPSYSPCPATGGKSSCTAAADVPRRYADVVGFAAAAFGVGLALRRRRKRC